MPSLETLLPDRTLNGFSLRNGNSNHLPMAAEALETLGRIDGLARLIEVEGEGVEPLPSGSEIDADAERAAALGRWDRAGDWLATARTDLRMDDWREVVPRWVALLAPGAVSGLFHGLLRTAHAVRSLARTRSNVRADELARGLAFWAATWQPPLAAAGNATPLAIAEAIRRVPLVPTASQILTGSGRSRLAVAQALPGFGAVALLADLRDPPTALLEMGRVSAGLLHANAARAGIMFVHCVTASAAALELIPLLALDAARDLARHVWMGIATVTSAQAALLEVPRAATVPAWVTLTDRAVASGDAHAIKGLEASLRLTKRDTANDGLYRDAVGAYLKSLNA